MKRANISTTKNNLSKLLDEVRQGQSIIIVDRDVPVARLQPVGDLADPPDRLASLTRDGIVSLPERQLDVEEFLGRTRAVLAPGASVVQAILDDREESR